MEIPREEGYTYVMAESHEPTSPSSPQTGRTSWSRATMWMVIVLILVSAGIYVFKSLLSAPGEVIGRTGRALADVASAFRRGTITTSFVSYATTISNYHYLQFATLKQTEIFTRSEAPITGFGYIPLPEVVVEARAPVEYTYYLDLNAKWEMNLRDNILYVLAPPIKFNKPAVDASAITYEVRKGYVKTAEAQEKLKKSITSLVALKAKENIPLVRETGRKQTADFVEKWLAKSFSDGNKYAVKVYFPDETPPDGVKIILPPAQ
jgi:hypothetical protein